MFFQAAFLEGLDQACGFGLCSNEAVAACDLIEGALVASRKHSAGVFMKMDTTQVRRQMAVRTRKLDGPDRVLLVGCTKMVSSRPRSPEKISAKPDKKSAEFV